MPTTVVIGGTCQHPVHADALRNAAGEGKATLMAFLSDHAQAHLEGFEGTPTAPADVHLDLREGDLW